MARGESQAWQRMATVLNVRRKTTYRKACQTVHLRSGSDNPSSVAADTPGHHVETNDMPSIGNKIPAAIPPLERWRDAVTGEPVPEVLSGKDPVAAAARALEASAKHSFSWHDVDMVMGALQLMYITAPTWEHATPVPIEQNWDARLWHIAEKIASFLPPRDEPPHELLQYGVNQELATYPTGWDGTPWTGDHWHSKAKRVQACLAGGIVADLHEGRIGHATQLTLFTLEGLLRTITRSQHKGICHPPSVVFHAYRRWFRTRFQPLTAGPLEELDGWLVFETALHGEVRAGRTTWAVLKSDQMGTPSEPVNKSCGSDAVVRAAPAGFFDEDPFSLGAEIASLTHGHQEAAHAAGAFAVLIHFLLKGCPLEFGVRQAVARLEGVRDREFAVRLCDAYLWGRQRPNVSAVAERYPNPRRAGDALCLAVLSAASAVDGRALRGEAWEGPESLDGYSTGSRSVRTMRGQILGCIGGSATLPDTDLGRDLGRIVTRLADDVETEFRDDDEWWRAYPGW